MMAPTALIKSDESENTLSPHKNGISEPMVEPIKIPIQINGFEDIS